MSGHYYNIKGEACHTQITKSGPNKGKERNTTKADAKRKKLFPSVSAYTGVIDKPFLTPWKVRETLKVAFDCPPVGGETEQQWMGTIQSTAEKNMSRPAERGTELHDVIERRTKWNMQTDAPHSKGEDNPFVMPVLDELYKACDGIPIAHTEKVVVNAAMGYAGTADVILADGRIIDYKSKSFKGKDTVEPSKDHPMQLAAYFIAANGLAVPFLPCTNIYFCREEPGKIMVKTWTPDELEAAWQAFEHCCFIFRYMEEWDPRQ